MRCSFPVLGGVVLTGVLTAAVVHEGGEDADHVITDLRQLPDMLRAVSQH